MLFNAPSFFQPNRWLVENLGAKVGNNQELGVRN